MPFETAEEAVAVANDSDFGLAATVWTNDLGTALRTVDASRPGTSRSTRLRSHLELSYGGYKQSGLGRELTLDSMVEHFTAGKSVVLNFD